MVTALRAAGEETRLRLLAVLAHSELTVSELCSVLRQSQPRVSRHLKLLVEAGLLNRHAQGSNAYYRPTRNLLFRAFYDQLIATLDPVDEAVIRDLDRLADIRAERARSAAAYFERIATDWDALRSLHVADEAVEQAILDITSDLEVRDLLDIGTGTGRMLELFADRIATGLGIDASQQMLNLARHRLDEQGLNHCSVRHDDAYDLGVDAASFDLVLVHQVLHFLDDPGLALRQAARALRPGGRLVVVDFAEHNLESLREEAQHHWLGFDDSELHGWFQVAGLQPGATRALVGGSTDRPLTVTIWTASPARHEVQEVTS